MGTSGGSEWGVELGGVDWKQLGIGIYAGTAYYSYVGCGEVQIGWSGANYAGG